MKSVLVVVMCAASLFYALPVVAQSPSIDPGGVVNSADYTAAMAPGALIAIFGANLGPAQPLLAPSAPLPTALAGVPVEYTGPSGSGRLPLVFVAAKQINAQFPYTVSGDLQITVINAAGRSASAPITVTPVAPRFFTFDANGRRAPIVLHTDGNLVSAQSPARPGETE